MVFFGLTGGIACGKSTVAKRFASRGVPVVDADQLAREVVQKGSQGLADIVRTFGEAVLSSDGSLDRKALAAIVFGDDIKRRALNAITHPRIAEAGMLAAKALADAGHPLACYEASLLVENGIADMFRPLVVVRANEADQIARIVARDSATEAEAVARIRAQMPVADKVRVADFVIDAGGTLDATLSGADDVLRRVCERAKVDAARYF